MIAAGATHIAFGPPLGPDFNEALRLSGERVLPYFRDSGGRWRVPRAITRGTTLPTPVCNPEICDECKQCGPAASVPDAVDPS